jgi:hypothetical protein
VEIFFCADYLRLPVPLWVFAPSIPHFSGHLLPAGRTALKNLDPKGLLKNTADVIHPEPNDQPANLAGGRTQWRNPGKLPSTVGVS